MIARTVTLLFEDLEVIKPFLNNLTNENIDFLRDRIPFEDIEELSGIGDKNIKDAFKDISGARFWEIFLKFAPMEEVINLIKQFPEEFFKTLFEKIPREEWVKWTDSQIERNLLEGNLIESLKDIPEDIKLYLIYNILIERLESIGNDEKEKLVNEYREVWFYFDRTQIKEYPPEMARGLPSFIKDMLKKGPPWSSDTEDLIEHWGTHPLGDWETHLRRNWELEPAYIKEGIKIPSKVRELYSETRRSYIYGQFKSSIALSRAVIEVALKEKFNLDKHDRNWTAGKTLASLLAKKMINEKIYYIADDIVVRADEILHTGKNIAEEKTLYFLNKTKDFIELFYVK